MADVIKVIIPVIGTVISIIAFLATLFHLSKRIKKLECLTSDGRELFDRLKFLSGLKQNLDRRVKELLSGNERKKSDIATSWFERVFELECSICNMNIEKRLDDRKSSWNCLFGLYQNCKLATVVGGCLAEANQLIKETKHFQDSNQLVEDAPEKLVILRTLEAKAESLKKTRKRIETLKNSMRKRVDEYLLDSLYDEWFRKVDEWFREVDSFIDSSSVGSFRCAAASPYGTPCQRCSSCDDFYERGKKMAKFLEDAELLRKEANDHLKDTERARLADVELIPIYSEVFGQKEELKRALELIEEEDGKVGIWGMGGVGKTTLLHRINNHFHRNRNVSFDLVIFVTAGRDACIERVQVDIGERLDISDLNESGDKRKQASKIRNSLQSKNFLLLVDDVWEEIDQTWLGIPVEEGRPEKKRKVVVFTTRHQTLCPRRRMIHLGLLSDELSWKLFCKHLDHDELLGSDEEIKKLAEEIVKECGRLPLALFVVGKSMTHADEPYEWRDARNKLVSFAHKFKEMDNKVLIPLKFSYDRLKNDAMRNILFLCMLHGSVMSQEDLARKALLESMQEADDGSMDEFLTDIKALVQSGLLMFWRAEKSMEAVFRDYARKVSLHDCVHDMLVWLIDNDKDKRLPMVLSTKGRISLEKWEGATRISMNGCESKEIPEDATIPDCQRLISFIGGRNKFVRLAVSFFRSMPCLIVLDLSSSISLKELPESIDSLVNLRYLNLSHTRIRKLPKETGKLEKLVYLCLTHTLYLDDIPQECFYKLHNLQELYIKFSSFVWTWHHDDNREGSEQASLYDIRNLVEVRALRKTDIRFLVDEVSIMETLADSPQLLSCIGYLSVDFSNFREVIENVNLFLKSVTNMRNLIDLNLRHVTGYFQVKFHWPFPKSIASVVIDRARCTLLNLAWTKYFPGLKEFEVKDSENLTTLQPSSGEEESCSESSSPKELLVENLCLRDCPKLNCIANKRCRFPKLKILRIEDCPQLKHVPFCPQNAPQLTSIVWNNLKVSMKWLLRKEEVERFSNMMMKISGLPDGGDMLIGEECPTDWLVFMRRIEEKTNFFEVKVKALMTLQEERKMELNYPSCSRQAKEWFDKVDSFLYCTSGVFFNFTFPPLVVGEGSLISDDDANIGEMCLPRKYDRDFIRDHGKELLQFYQGVIAQESRLMEEGRMDIADGNHMQLENSRDQMLTIEPFVLLFPLELQKQISCSFRLSNNTPYQVTFKVRPMTTNRHKYCVGLQTGTVEPRSTMDVEVMMEEHEEVPQDLLQCKDRFIVESNIAEEENNIIEEEIGNANEEINLPVMYDMTSLNIFLPTYKSLLVRLMT